MKLTEQQRELALKVVTTSNGVFQFATTKEHYFEFAERFLTALNFEEMQKDAARFKAVANSAYQCADSRGPIWQIDVRVRDWNFIRDVDLVTQTEENL